MAFADQHGRDGATGLAMLRLLQFRAAGVSSRREAPLFLTTGLRAFLQDQRVWGLCEQRGSLRYTYCMSGPTAN